MYAIHVVLWVVAARFERVDAASEATKREQWNNRSKEPLPFQLQLKSNFQRGHVWLSMVRPKKGSSFRTTDRVLANLMRTLLAICFAGLFHSEELTRFIPIAMLSSAALLCAQLILQACLSNCGVPGYREQWENERGLASSAACCCPLPSLPRFPAWVRYVLQGACLLVCSALSVCALALGLRFDQNSRLVCAGANAASWAGGVLFVLLLEGLVNQPLVILLRTAIARWLPQASTRPIRQSQQPAIFSVPLTKLTRKIPVD